MVLSYPLLSMTDTRYTPPVAPTVPFWFQLGHTYRTLAGARVKIVAISRNLPGYECAKGSDGAWRYDRRGDHGRVTGTSGQDPRNLIAGEV